jgi:hypothetical protein
MKAKAEMIAELKRRIIAGDMTVLTAGAPYGFTWEPKKYDPPPHRREHYLDMGDHVITVYLDEEGKPE